MPVVLPYPRLILIIQKDCTYKDSVFCRIFNEKKELLSLYNALFLEQRNENITVEEEVELAQRIKKGDQEALEKLTKANLPFWFYAFNTL